MNIARRLGDLPPNICTPTFLAGEARTFARKQPGVSAKILDEKAMRELGMGALLSVSAGSDEPAKLIVLEYKGGKKRDGTAGLGRQRRCHLRQRRHQPQARGEDG